MTTGIGEGVGSFVVHVNSAASGVEILLRNRHDESD